MISITSVKIDEKTFLGVKIELPDSPPLLIVTAEKGFVMCSFLNLEAAERIGVAAAVVSDVRSIEDVLNAEVKATTSKAKNLGVVLGMKSVEALKHLSSSGNTNA